MDTQLTPTLPVPPGYYDPEYLARLVRVIELYFSQNAEPGYVRASSLAVTQLPTNGGGLRVGDVFSDGGTLKIVGTNDVFSGTTVGTTSVGTVTVTVS